MIAKPKSVAALLSILIASTSPYSAPLQAQASANCGAEIDQLERNLRAFDRDVKDQNLDFIKNDVAEASLRGIRTRLAGNPTSEALFDLKDKKDKFDEYIDNLKAMRLTLADLQKCIATRGCSLLEFAKRQNEALKKWIESLGDEGITAAAERVNKAASLIQGYAERALSMALNSALNAVNNCTAQFERNATTNSTPAGTSTPGGGTPPAQAPPPVSSGGGMGAGAILGWGGLVAGGLTGAYLWEQALAEQAASTPTGTNTGTGTPTSSGFNGTFRAQVTRTCQAGPFPAVCGQAVENSSCSPTNFTFTVTSGAVRDCGGWFNASVSANGTWSGTYTGSAPNIPLSGSSAGMLTGSITSQGSAYQVRIVVTRQ